VKREEIKKDSSKDSTNPPIPPIQEYSVKHLEIQKVSSKVSTN